MFVCDAESLRRVFTRFGFKVVVHPDLTADAIKQELMRLGKRNFGRDDAMVRGPAACLETVWMMWCFLCAC